jgi:hypothetical protein
MSYTYRFNYLNREYNIDLYKNFKVLINEFTKTEDICKIIRFFPTISLKKLDTIYKFLEENSSIRIFYIPIIHQDIAIGYKTAHFLIQQDQEDDGKYIFIGNINYHIDDELNLVIEEYFLHYNTQYYSIEQLLLMIDNQYIGLFCDIFDNDNYYNDSYNLYFENQNYNYNFLQYDEEENEEDNQEENEYSNKEVLEINIATNYKTLG